MNNLSWFIYLTQLADGVRGTAFGILLAGSFGLLVWFIVAFGMKAFEGMDAPMNALKSNARWMAAVYVCAALIMIAIPSRQTLVLIAGSEVGERVVNSDAVQGVVNPGMDLVKLWIKKETEALTKAAQ